jgi:hypothetical protein
MVRRRFISTAAAPRDQAFEDFAAKMLLRLGTPHRREVKRTGNLPTPQLLGYELE